MTAPILLVTGTDTEVGKTVTTAAIAAALIAQGMHVAVVKPTQTGLAPGEAGDVDEVARLVGDLGGDDAATGLLTTHEFVRLPDPLAPDSAARLAQVTLPTVAEHARRVLEIAERDDVDTVIVEGAGGLLVHLDGEGNTLADLGIALRDAGARAGFVLVVASRLGTLNVTALTAEALARRELDLIGYVVGSYPSEPDLAERTNIDDLPTAAGAQPLGRIPTGAASLEPAEFRTHATEWVHL